VWTFVTQHQVTALAAPATIHVGAVLIFCPLAIAVVIIASLADANGEERVAVYAVTGSEFMRDL
jgi:hypothetical protein